MEKHERKAVKKLRKKMQSMGINNVKIMTDEQLKDWADSISRVMVEGNMTLMEAVRSLNSLGKAVIKKKRRWTMKGKINIAGYLEIDRAGHMKRQLCPYTMALDEHGYNRACGDWCPMFGGISVDGTQHLLDICNASFDFDEFTDER